MIKYKLFDESHHLDIETTVMRKLKEGWQLAGSPFCVDGVFYQPMLKDYRDHKTNVSGITQSVVVDGRRVR